MNAVTFVVEGRPKSKDRPRVGAGGKIYTPAATKDYEEAVKVAYLKSARRYNRDAQGRYGVHMIVRVPDRRRQDLDNIVKSILDGLNGVAFGDDSQVDQLSVRRSVHKGGAASVTVVVEKLEV